MLKLMFLTDTHLNELNLKLQGQGKTVLDLFCYWKSIYNETRHFTRDINIKAFKYFPYVKNHSNQFEVNIDKLQEYNEALKSEFNKQSQDFHNDGSLFSYLIKPDIFDLETTLLELFSWILKILKIEFRSSELWTSKFVKLRKSLEDENLEKYAAILS